MTEIATPGQLRMSYWRWAMVTVPSIVLVFIVSSISALKVFDELFVLAKGSPIAQQTAVPLLYRIAFEEGDYGLASALGLSIFLFILSFSLVNLRLTARSEEAAS